MKSILAITSLVLLIAITTNAQTEKKSSCCSETKIETSQIDKSNATDIQSTLDENPTHTVASLSGDDDSKKFEGKDKVECEKKSKGKSKEECKKTCETKETEEVPKTEGTSEQE